MGTTAAAAAATQAYGESWYWDRRYETDSGAFDWYQKYSALAPLVNLYVPREDRVLVVGCGNSEFSEGMVDDGYEDVVNIDISSVVIEAMQKKYSNRPQLKYMKMDVREMSGFDSHSFNAVIDKGTPVGIILGKTLLRCSRKLGGMLNLVNKYSQLFCLCSVFFLISSPLLKQSMTNYRVLKDKGVYILITYGAPTYRLNLLKEMGSWTIKLHVIEKLVGKSDHLWELTNPLPLDNEGSSAETLLGRNPDVHYIYVCTKVG
ncbi:hypothetical protein ACJRO7_032595 [Eucalyptus globulus]|uniref:Methyltransferase domain-containing protein n=1 Tax=Eucalyptus globulus TaxID=34317 RepID=A0ABD3JWM2_EUCGL